MSYNIKKSIVVKSPKLNNYKELILTADIGGTNTNYGLFGITKTRKCTLITKYRIDSKEIKMFSEATSQILETIKKDYKKIIKKACIGTAGPLAEDRKSVKITNLKWDIRVDNLTKNTNLKEIILLNDFEAIGYGLSTLDLNDKKKIFKLKTVRSKQNQKSTIALIGPGTGLGVSIINYNNTIGQYIPNPSEGGQTNYAPSIDIEWEMKKYVDKKILRGHQPDYEHFVSGPGIANIYRFLRTKVKENSKYTKEIDNISDNEKGIKIANYYEKSKTCKKTMELFTRAFARRAMDLSLTSLCYSGLFIAGGISSHIIDILKKEKFKDLFIDNIKMKHVLKKIPIYIVMDYDISLYGCANRIVNF